MIKVSWQSASSHVHAHIGELDEKSGSMVVPRHDAG